MAEVMGAKEAVKDFFGGAISYTKLLALAKSGQVPSVRVGGRVLFRWSSLEKWMAEQETAAVTQEQEETNLVQFGVIRKIR